jgi:hypothetical protein
MRPQLADLLKEQKVALLFPDFPANFTPPWFGNPDYVVPNKQPLMLAVIAVTTAIMSVIVLTRLIVRGCSKRGVWGLDDWLVIPAWV